MSMENQPAQRIVLVSNRLPFTVATVDGAVEFLPSAGGVATGLHALLTAAHTPILENTEYVWIGWPGAAVCEESRDQVRAEALSRYHASPVFLSEAEIESFYSGFCNKTIWPLFHYFPQYARHEPEYWAHYLKVNQAFADAALEVLRPGDLLWIHDYHLMLLPQLIRARLPQLSIGFFLHIPFPHYEIFRLLPEQWRRELLEGLLGSDVIGFHTFDYGQYFLRCVLRVLGHESHMGKLLVGDRSVKVGAFPMGVPFDKFAAAAASGAVAEEAQTLRGMLPGTKLVLSIDRQDYSKGILHRLQGFESMLEANPHWRGQVTLLMVVVPSRIGIEDYEQMKKQIEEVVGRINGKFGDIGWTPILYQYRSLSFDSLVALYSISDVALVTPLRDGMNLIAKEYIASRLHNDGVLILSEMAGAARELGEAIIINPNIRDEIASALVAALNMPAMEQGRRMEIMQERLSRCDLSQWAQDILRELVAVQPSRQRVFAKLLGLQEMAALLNHYRRAPRRLIMLDFDGTLVPLVDDPRRANPTPALLKILASLAADPANELVLISGRDRATLHEWFANLPVGLAAEHGAWRKKRSQQWTLARNLSCDWKPKLSPMMIQYADRLPGAFVEEKEFSLVWHYRRADSEQGMVVARELMDDLLLFTGNIDVKVVQGNRTVEVRSLGLAKSLAARSWLRDGEFDFILAVGDDHDDEELFGVLPQQAYSIRVGITQTGARFNLREPKEVVTLLEALTEAHALTRPAENSSGPLA